MFVPFLYDLKRIGVKVGAQEAVALAEALHKGLHESSLDGFYYVARSILIHREADLDSFDVAFAKHFQGVDVQVAALKSELDEWLRNAKENIPQLTPEERALFDALSREEIQKMFEERLREQNERHDGGSKWIGTGGKSPFGHSGAPRPGIRVGGSGGGRSAIHVAGERQYAGYRDDLQLQLIELLEHRLLGKNPHRHRRRRPFCARQT